MSKKVKLTKQELKRCKDELKRFKRYLPMLELKKTQLTVELRRIRSEIEAARTQLDALTAASADWLGLLNDDPSVGDYVEIETIVRGNGNIAGVDIPVFKGVTFKDLQYDLFAKPLWFDPGVEMLKKLFELKATITVLEEQEARIAEELRVTSQRVNLFEKVMIPSTRQNIRTIQLFLGDQQTAAVVRGKISKNKLRSAS